jgi:nascent polypeptide-associated complex subunit alpha
MPSVSDELEALRNRNLTKNLAGKLKNADGLSTPEQEEATLQQTNNTRRASTYQKEAADNLKAGTKAADQELEFKRKQIALKKEDKQKQKEASNNLQSFNQAKVATSALTGNREKEKKIEQADKAAHKSTKQVTTASVSTPAAATKTTPSPSTKITDNAIPVLDEQDDVPELEDQVPVVPPPSQETQPYVPAPPAKRTPNRVEKKAKKAMEKLGMKGVLGISRVTLKMGGSQGFYTIHQPDVYEKNGTYIVFGEAQQGAGWMEQQKQAERAAKMLETSVPAQEKLPTTGAAAAADIEVDEVVDESGLEAKDIDLVVGQSGCSRSKAIIALRANNGDLVNAIMSLTA